jgi:hypothetical protein
MSSGGAATGGAGSAGQAAGGVDTMGVPATFESVMLLIDGTTPPCVSADCHGYLGPNVFQMNKMDPDQVYNSLLTTRAEACNCMPVVDPGHPENSALITLLSGPCGKTPQMPKDCDPDPVYGNCVPANFTAAIAQWIANGAPRN